MPIYEYRCKECQQVFEKWCKHVEDGTAQHACPVCKGQADRLISQTSFALKGGGWYVTEYGSRKNTPSQAPKPAEKSGGSGEASSNSTPPSSASTATDASTTAAS